MDAEKLNALIKTKMKEAGLSSEYQLSKITGMGQQNLNRKLKNGRLTFIEVCNILDALGFEIDIKSTGRGAHSLVPGVQISIIK